LPARHAVGFREAHQLALKLNELPVDGVELLDQAFDPRIVELQLFQLFDDRGLRGFVGFRLGAGQRLALQAQIDALFLQRRR
jgi:hypothetical protein